jgi:hypothetical protein
MAKGKQKITDKMSEFKMPPLAALNQVLETPEILESILLHLPLRDLLVTAQRINHAWNNLIVSSPAIQEALFFQARSQSSGSRDPSIHFYKPPFLLGLRKIMRKIHGFTE